MSERYGCAVAPARVRRPRDKGSVEMGVAIIERQAMTALRNRRFVSLAELNRALIDQVAAINPAPSRSARAAGRASSSARGNR